MEKINKNLIITKFIVVALVFFIGCFFSAFSGEKNKSIKIIANGDVYRGDTGPIYNKGGQVAVNDGILTTPATYSVDVVTWTITEVSIDARTHYDLQSNSCTNYIIQNPLIPSNIHTCFMVATDPNPWNTRNTRYFFTTSGGTNWDYLGYVSTTRSGFPCITMTTDGRAVIMHHCTDGGGILRAQVFVDVAPGAGSWNRYDPGTTGGTITPIWPDAFYDRGSNKLLFCVSQQVPGDSLFRNVQTGFSGSGTFLGYQAVAEGETAGQYSVAVTPDGTRYGLAYCTNSGGAGYITSTNDGVTWSSPTTIWTWSPLDSMGTLRSIDLVYDSAGVPKVVFGIGNVDPVGGTFIPGLPSKLKYWSPNVNGGVPITIDSADGLTGPNPANDVFFSVTRGVVGMAVNNSAVYVAYNKARPDTSAEGNNFFDVWFRYSTDAGANWSTKYQLTNVSGPLKDWRYPSISPTNHINSLDRFVHIIAQMDSIPGSSVNGAPDSWARMMYIKITISPSTGIKQIGGEVPSNYSLSQNYPNPFNPKTNIQFDLPKKSFVKIIVYNSIGQETAIIVNEELNTGSYKVDWDASDFPSGVYFYVIKAENYFEGKKMILVK